MRINTPKLLFAISVNTIIIVFLFIAPIPQNLSYHSFADKLTIFSTNNFWNVISNFGFIITGIYGLYITAKFKKVLHYNIVLFSGIILTAFGSAYYHYNPNNETLLWDRLPMTIVFTTFFAQLYSWYFSKKTGFTIWIIGLILGVFSVFYWKHTESIGKGDLRLYAIVQFLPIVLMLIILGLHYNKHKPLIKPFILIIVWYVFAKFLEHYDYQILSFTKIIGGHPMKHVAAAVATFYIVVMVRNYRLSNVSDS